MDSQKVLSLTKALRGPFSKMLTEKSLFTFSDMLRILRNVKKEKFGKTFLLPFKKEDLFLSTFLLYMENQKGFTPQETLRMLDRAFSIVLLEDTGNKSTTMCDYCDGDGEVNCSWCENGEVDCDSCINGEAECEDCEGTGEENDGEPCSTCQGGGTVQCDSCQGDGTIRCDDCAGGGTEECSECEGDGTIYKEGSNDYTLSIWITMDQNLKKFQVGEKVDSNEFDEIRNNSHLILHEEYLPLKNEDWSQVFGKAEIIVIGSTDSPTFFDSLVDTVMTDYSYGVDHDELENFLLDYLQPGKTYFRVPRI
jgi:hypothetical protein